MSEKERPNNYDPIVVYVMPGSQYSAKVLLALDARGIPHYCSFVSTYAKRRNLPSGGTMVPEVTVGASGDNLQILTDSERILHWFDDHLDTNFFPKNNNDGSSVTDTTTASEELSMRASDGILAGAVLYYNWVDPEGYARSMRAMLAETLVPFYVPSSLLKCTLVDWFVAAERSKFANKAATAMGLAEANLSDESRVRQMLLEELLFFQSLLKSPDQIYLLPGSKNEVTAVDCSVYPMVERLVGNMGDAKVHPSFPKLKKETPQLERFWKWHDEMTRRHFLRFKGKRPPAAKK